jgi:hypothetical protein
MEVEGTAVIKRPIAAVWDFYAVHHVENHPRWDPDMALEQVTSGPIGVGTVITRHNTRFGESVDGSMEITQFDAPRVMGVRIRDGETEMLGRGVLTPDGPTWTRLTIHVEIPGAPPSEAERFGPFVQRSVETIKRLVEAETRADSRAESKAESTA